MRTKTSVSRHTIVGTTSKHRERPDRLLLEGEDDFGDLEEDEEEDADEEDDEFESRSRKKPQNIRSRAQKASTRPKTRKGHGDGLFP